MGYIEELRALVGKRPLILTAAGVIILDEADRILLIRRTDDGTWLRSRTLLRLPERRSGLPGFSRIRKPRHPQRRRD